MAGPDRGVSRSQVAAEPRLSAMAGHISTACCASRSSQNGTGMSRNAG